MREDEERWHLEFRVGQSKAGGWVVGAFIDGKLERYRGPFATKEKALAGRDAWVAELEAEARESGEEMHAIH